MAQNFDQNADFALDYQEILTVPGIPTEIDRIYTLERIHSGRFIIFERQKKQGRLHVGELEVLAYLT